MTHSKAKNHIDKGFNIKRAFTSYIKLRRIEEMEKYAHSVVLQYESKKGLKMNEAQNRKH